LFSPLFQRSAGEEGGELLIRGAVGVEEFVDSEVSDTPYSGRARIRHSFSLNLASRRPLQSGHGFSRSGTYSFREPAASRTHRQPGGSVMISRVSSSIRSARLCSLGARPASTSLAPFRAKSWNGQPNHSCRCMFFSTASDPPGKSRFCTRNV